MLTASHAARISGVLGCEATWLSEALPFLQDRGKSNVWHIYGQRVDIRSHLRGMHPQVCPRCIHHDGYCRKEWDLSITAICRRHKCSLVDQCQRCHGRLRWDRPDLGVCHCGAILQSTTGQDINPGVLMILSAVEVLMMGEPYAPVTWLSVGLPAIASDLSLNGLMALVHAFGVNDAAHQAGRTQQFTRVARTHEWVGILERGSERLRRFEAANRSQLQELAELVSQSLLVRLAKAGSRGADAQVGLHVLEQLFGKTEARRLHSNHIQMELFE